MTNNCNTRYLGYCYDVSRVWRKEGIRDVRGLSDSCLPIRGQDPNHASHSGLQRGAQDEFRVGRELQFVSLSLLLVVVGLEGYDLRSDHLEVR